MPNQLSGWSFKLTSLLKNKDWSHGINVITEDYFIFFKFDGIFFSTVWHRNSDFIYSWLYYSY